MRCKKCEELAAIQWRAKEGQAQDDWREVYRLHQFYEHHNPPVFIGEKEDEMPDVRETSKKE